MNNNENIYELEEDQSAQDLKFVFISSGNQDIVKAIQYSFVQQLSGKNVYNLGFGDYNLENDTITDTVNTNNGDVYKVFNTVLSTIPTFFETYIDSILMVQGSDGTEEFIQNCRPTCVKGCGERCKNFNRRINVYKSFVNKHYNELIIDYQFIGGVRNEDNSVSLEEYIRYKDYNSVLVLKKNN